MIFSGITFEEAYDDVFCGSGTNVCVFCGSNILRDSRGDEPNVTIIECEGRCAANANCKYLLFGEAVWEGNPRCTLFKKCDQRTTYDDGDPKVYRKVTAGSTLKYVCIVRTNRNIMNINLY